MATSSYAKSLLGGVQVELRAALNRVCEYVFDRQLEFGPVAPQNELQSPTTNFKGVYVKHVTSGTANQEVATAHGLGRTPNVIWPVLKPNGVNSQIVPLTVSRAADSARVYLTSASTGATIFFYCE